MHIDISTDDRLSKLSLKMAYVSSFILIFSIALNVFNLNIGLMISGICMAGFILSIFGIILSNMARENDDEHISRCLRAKIFNIDLCVIYIIIYIIL